VADPGLQAAALCFDQLRFESAMAGNKEKLEQERFIKVIKELQSLPENKLCMTCGQRVRTSMKTLFPVEGLDLRTFFV
jgi:hypothetical protein